MRSAVASFCFCLFVFPAALAERVRFPEDSGVLRVTDFGAVPDDGQDDTEALQRVLDAHPSGNHVFYFPSGRYLISRTLRVALDDGVTKRNILQGEDRDQTVLQLIDGSGHDDAVIDFRAGPAQFFRNAVRNLTIDLGRGNPEATGLKFNASNQGTVSDVTIRSSDGGRVGLDLRHSDEVGPLLVRDLSIEGFEVGIWTGWQTASQTFVDIELNGQSRFGWVNEASQSVFVERLRSRNAVPAIWNARWGLPGDGQGKFVLIDAMLKGVEGAGERAAITNGKSMYVRNVRTPGYGRPLASRQRGFRGNGSLDGEVIEEYWANGAGEDRRGGPRELFNSPNRSLGLPIREAPVQTIDTEFPNWDGPHRHGGRSGDRIDDTAALQAACDSGATTIYLPRGRWRLDGDVKLGGGVQRVIGCEAIFEGEGSLIIAEDASTPLVIERLQGGGITYRHASRRTVVFRHLLGWTYESTVENPGDVFIEDVVGAPVVFRNQRVWARQLDIEGDIEARAGIEAKIVNDGGDLWLLGFKTEDDGAHVLTRHGGRTELLGALHVGASTEGPRFITEEASFSAAVAKGGSDRIQETRGGVTREGRLGNVDLYAAFVAKSVATIEMDNRDTSSIERVGRWDEVTPPPGGFIGADLLRAKPDSASRITFAPTIARRGRYQVALRWVNQISSPVRYSSATPVRVAHAGGTAVTRVDQRRHGGRWNVIGTYLFAPDEPAAITISTEGANGVVQADAVRLRRVEALEPNLE